MFRDVWTWAGSYRQSNPIIGCEWPQIVGNVLSLVRDVAHWIEASTYPLDEIAVRFHHRLVAVHPFPNGNGRHSRQATLYLAARWAHSVPPGVRAWACRHRTCAGSTSPPWSKLIAPTTSLHSSPSP